ncbi:hypothetical protein SB87_gp013 [Parapoxvirus red deer/HL953]|uniref:Cullin family profile domain-containing protein n=1 Tax=Parapoxvirus red deer/HL953 TaxID=1579460 RepID=A0A0A7MEP0_9POXV|nr:hypothetical protein SB87_gp013 [Parapoxvirus red deer/HL953]AIZ77266.1 hypothetical protein [Parapoxvirus red deer/HL953]
MEQEELTLLMCYAMEQELTVAQMNRLRLRLTKLRMNVFVAVSCLREAIARKSWLPAGSILGQDIADDVRLLEFMVQEVDRARENVEPYFQVAQWVFNADVFDECLRESMDLMFGDAVPRLALGVVEARYPHMMADRLYACLTALFTEDASVRFANSIMRHSGTMAGCLVERSRELGNCHDELADMVRHRNNSKLRLWPRIVDVVVSEVMETDVAGMREYCRHCLMNARIVAGGLLDMVKDYMTPVIVECIDLHVKEKNLDRALCLYIHFNAAVRSSNAAASVAAHFSGRNLYAAVVAAPPYEVDMILSYVGRLPKEDLSGFLRVATARIVKSIYTETALEKHLALKMAMEMHPQMISPSLSELVRRFMGGTLRLPMLPAPAPMEHDGAEDRRHDPDMALLPINAYTTPTPTPPAELMPPASLRRAVETAIGRADTVYEVTPLAAFGRAEVSIPVAGGEVDVVCSSAHLVCIVMMDDAGREGVTVEEVAAHLGGDLRLAEMSLLSLCREKIAKRRSVDSVRRFSLNTRREPSETPIIVFN